MTRSLSIGAKPALSKALCISTAHLPSPQDVSKIGLRWAEHEYGFVVFLVTPDCIERDTTPDWALRILDYCARWSVEFLIFDNAGPRLDDLQTWEW